MAEEAPVTDSQQDKESTHTPRIVRGRVDSLSLFEITDYELSVLESGSPATVYLNFSVFFLSTGLAYLISLLTGTFASIRLFTVLVVVTTVSFGIGLVLLVLWYRSRSSVLAVVKKIKDRCLVEPDPRPSSSERIDDS